MATRITSPGTADTPTAGLGAPARLRDLAADWFVSERARWALWIPVMFGIGIGAYFALPAEPASYIGPSLTVVLAIGAVLSRRVPVALFAFLAFAIAAAGFATAQLRTLSVDAPVLDRRIGPVAVEGRALSVETRETGRRIVLDRLKIGRLAAERTPARVRITLSGKDNTPAILPGDRVRLLAILSPPPEPAAPGAFDFARQAYFQQFGGVGFAVGKRTEVSRDAAGGGIRIAIERLRRTVTLKIFKALRDTNGATAGVAAALLTGDRGAIPERVLQDMRDSGLAHLLAISGLHIGLVAASVFFAVRLLLAAMGNLALRQPIKKWSAVAALIGAFGYLLLSGATVPTQRAFIMTGIVLLAILLDRTAISMRLVAWAAFLILLLRPESLLSASFQLSFAAVIALVAVYEGLSPRLGGWLADGIWRRRLLLYGATIVITTVVAGAATGPFALYHFNRLALYGVAANLLAIPLMGFWIMPFGVAALCLMPLGLEQFPLAAMGWGIDAVLAIAAEVASWPGAVALAPSIPVGALAAIFLGGLWLCLWRGRGRLAGVPVTAAGLAAFFIATPPDIWIGRDGKLTAIRLDGNTLAVSSLSRGSFERDMWRRRAAVETEIGYPREGYDATGAIACDGRGCVATVKGKRVAVLRDPAALAEDCGIADIVIAEFPIRRWQCRGPETVIGRFDLWRHGAHAVRIGANGIKVERASAARGDRPWSPSKESRD